MAAVLPNTKRVGDGKIPGVLEAVAVVVDIYVAVLTGAVGADASSENASTVSTIMVFILEMAKSMRFTCSVPINAALLISSRPTTEAPHIKPRPRTAATTTPRSGT